jgi:probable HAF family extracellular repeat protein
MLKTILLGLLFTVTLDPELAKAHPNYIIADLGTPPGADSTIASAINDRGQVVGFATLPAPPPSQPPLKGNPNPSFIDHVILFSNGRLRDLGPFGIDSAGATAINDHGQIIAFGDNNADHSIQSFLYTAGHIQALGSLGGSLTEALGINNFGLVVGWTTLSSGAQRAFLYDGQMHDLHLGDNTEATGINDLGQIIGDETGPAVGTTSAFVLTRGRIHFLPSLGGFATWAKAINNFGHVAGFSWVSDNSTYHAILYIDGRTKDLGTLSGSTGASVANSINIEDEIVGISVPLETGQPTPFLYSRGHMVDLNSLLPANSGWALQQANGINDLGQIAGSGTHNGLNRAFLMTPIR